MAAAGRRVAFITGAAHGIGAGTAKALADRGWSVALADLDHESVEAVAARCGTEAAAFEANITDQDAVDAAVAGAVERFGGLDVCFANAGIGTGGSLRHTDPDVFAVQVDVNLIGTFRTVHACLPHLIDSRGYLLLNASASALTAPPGVGSYGATKAAVESLGTSLRVELAHHGVDVGVLYLLWVKTDMVDGAEAESETFRAILAGMPGPLDRRMPLERAVARIVDGIESRSPRLLEPRYLTALRAVRGLAPGLLERVGREMAADVEAATVHDLEAEDGLEKGIRTRTPAGAAAAEQVSERQR
jgi:NAD(P)-dependent dehydrogenase (short-subunit alcohol dehydrogenase family)